jgi:hypothetical protein
MRRTRSTYLALIFVAVIVGSFGVYEFVLPLLFPSTTPQGTNPTQMKTIHIPPRSYIEPQYWNGTLGQSSPGFSPLNFTVVIGTNNTIEWINDDTVDHTVTALTVPQGATYFDSGFIGHGKTFTLTLTVPGVYKYDCAWHPWLAGVITVKSA